MRQQDRQKKIIQTSVLGILVNLAIAAVKIVIGLAAASLAIVSEGMNNATDAASSLLTLVGTKLSAKHPDEKHPFGYGRVEYLTGVVISVLILYTGVSLVKESVEGILHPGEMSVTLTAILIVAVTAVVKFALGVYTLKTGKTLGSASLEAVGEEGRNDAIFSLVTIAVSLIYLFAGISLDAYAGLVFAAVVIKSGFGTLKESTGDILGRPGKKELARTLYKEIRRTPGILNAADMMLHDYGPDAYAGSVNIEIDHGMTIGEAYDFIHRLQLRIMHEYRVTMVFGIYAVDNDHAQIREIRRNVGAFIRKQEHVKSIHALYLDSESQRLYCDFVVDYALRDWDGLRQEFGNYMKELYPDFRVELTVETEYV